MPLDKPYAGIPGTTYQLQPGVIFGLVAGLTYAVTLVATRNAIVVVVGSGFGGTAK